MRRRTPACIATLALAAALAGGALAGCGGRTDGGTPLPSGNEGTSGSTTSTSTPVVTTPGTPEMPGTTGTPG